MFSMPRMILQLMQPKRITTLARGYGQQILNHGSVQGMSVTGPTPVIPSLAETRDGPRTHLARMLVDASSAHQARPIRVVSAVHQSGLRGYSLDEYYMNGHPPAQSDDSS